MEIAIIDDDEIFSKQLNQIVDKFMKTILKKYNVDIINDNFYLSALKKQYDIIFLDIDLNDLSGIDVGKKLMIAESNPIIIFVSSRDDLVFSSLSVRPFYFVRKSSLKDDLQIMFILLKKYLKDNMNLLTFDFYGRQTSLFLKDIFVLESRGHDIVLHTKNGEYSYRSTMKNILEKLGTETIVQFQKAYAVNLDYIMEINKGTILLKNGEQFNIGRKFKENVLQKYKEHFLRWLFLIIL